MLKETKLTNEWQDYNGYYEKRMQDIQLANGDIVYMCWPNGGLWIPFNEEHNPVYYGRRIPHMEAVKVRLTHIAH